MPERPRDSNNSDAMDIPVERVQAGMTLVVDRGEGPQLFQVENVAFSSKRADDGGYVNAWTLTSGQVADGGDPWKIEYAAGSSVRRILGPSKN
jgi:hypothetical protein